MMILVILSHGRDSAIFASDGTCIPTEEIYKKFNNENCPALMGKPKFFIIQACRGDETDAGMFFYCKEFIATYVTKHSLIFLSFIYFSTGKIDEDEGLYEGNVGKKCIKRRREGNYDSIPISNYSDLDTCRPTWEDMCIAYSTIPGLWGKNFLQFQF